MILISHRGNLQGRNIQLENNPQYIEDARKAGFYVEIDLWVINDMLYLGHDEPQYLIDSQFINNKFYFVHCKNHEALLYMNKNSWSCDYFWHEEDHYTLTSKNKIWAHPKASILPESICVVINEDEPTKYSNCLGVCSDYIGKFKNETK